MCIFFCRNKGRLSQGFLKTKAMSSFRRHRRLERFGRKQNRLGCYLSKEYLLLALV
jgi:hypothetical protein